MNMLVRNIQRSAVALGMAAALMSMVAPAQAQSTEQFIAI